MSQPIPMNFYYPYGEKVNCRVRCVYIERTATVVQLAAKIREIIDPTLEILLFKVSFEWHDINPGGPNEPHILTLSNLIRLLNGQPVPLPSYESLNAVLPLEMITGARSATYCSLLAVPAKAANVILLRPPSAQSTDLEKLLSDPDVTQNDYDQYVTPILKMIDQYSTDASAYQLSSWRSPFNGKRLPSIPSSCNPDMQLYHIFGEIDHRVPASDAGGVIDHEFWEQLARTGSNF